MHSKNYNKILILGAAAAVVLIGGVWAFLNSPFTKGLPADEAGSTRVGEGEGILPFVKGVPPSSAGRVVPAPPFVRGSFCLVAAIPVDKSVLLRNHEEYNKQALLRFFSVRRIKRALFFLVGKSKKRKFYQNKCKNVCNDF